MTGEERKKHWEKIYASKALPEVSWYQPVPKTSLELIDKWDIPPTDAVIDIGGGDSFLVDNLLEKGFEDLTVLDISRNAIERAKTRLGKNAKNVDWIISDVTNFSPKRKYDLWHDRAAFHFLTEKRLIANYVETAYTSLSNNGKMIIGVFSTSGPEKCSGLNIRQYDKESIRTVFDDKFEMLHTDNVAHTTPFDTVQDFLFCTFRKKHL